MPNGFRFPQDAEVWTPMQFSPKDLESRSNHVIWATGRLEPRVTLQQAQAEMDLIMPRLQQVWTATLVPVTEHYLGDIRSALYILFGAAGFVLLIACVNIAGLLVARGSSRQREIAMRAAIGASRARIVQQLLVETTVIALTGGALGVFLTLIVVDTLKKLPINGIASIGRRLDFSPRHHLCGRRLVRHWCFLWSRAGLALRACGSGWLAQDGRASRELDGRHQTAERSRGQ